jgi:hypothetical protein
MTRLAIDFRLSLGGLLRLAFAARLVTLLRCVLCQVEKPTVSRTREPVPQSLRAVLNDLMTLAKRVL